MGIQVSESSHCLSLANTFESTFNIITITPLACFPRAARGLSIYGYSVKPRSESSVSMNHPAIPDAINYIAEAPQDLQGSNDVLNFVSELDNSPAARLVLPETHPWYKSINGAIKMPQESMPVRFKDAKKPIKSPFLPKPRPFCH
ncbi:hypothetical protein FRB93_003045 [Tulasnella sp. JGI-2019a]|nr:hypothetical protein FRB93_003045 [Tulasnella sp. JGI-2019a]